MDNTPVFHPLDYVSVVRRRMWWLIVPVVLATVIGAVLRYDYPEDEEAKELQEAIRAAGERSALARYAGIGENHPLVDLVVERLDLV